MTIKTLLYVFFVVGLDCVTYGQNTNRTLFLVDAQTKEPVVFANIVIANLIIGLTVNKVDSLQARGRSIQLKKLVYQVTLTTGC